MAAAHVLGPRRRIDHRKSWGLVDVVERRLMRPWTRRQPPEVEELLVGLTRAGEHSVLWLVLAAAGALFGGRPRRAAEHGVLALVCTSTTVNGLKLVSRRRRPRRRRLLRRTPRSSSFPSGHSASAFAFAVAASRELPEAGPLLVPLAAGVAYSRVYLGVHYPSDVIVGAAIGTAFGLAARPAAQRLGIDSGEAPDSTSARAHVATLRRQAASALTTVREAQHATAAWLAAHADATEKLLHLGRRIKDAEHGPTADPAADRTMSTDA